MPRKSVFTLTQLERKVLALAQRGMNNIAIAKYMGWRTPRTDVVYAAIKKHQLSLVDDTRKSHAPDSLHKAHGRNLESFIK